MCEIAKAIGFGMQEDGTFINPSYSEFADRIADLIEPEPEKTERGYTKNMMHDVKFVNENFKTICISVKVEEGY